ncbi:MAG: GntR family transcriptional regulator [Clostridiales bacterium]|jgi:DNA-binding GntR family transcriptional regulator|nr:GntR family transcriptional regulator [Clostridiales bacterium]
MENVKSLKLKAYDHIKNKIFSCCYLPGDFLDEKTLIGEIGASRTPIREALNKIEQENLIQIISKKGIMVKHITAKNVLDIFQIRETLEPNAILNCSDKIDMGIINEFKRKFLIEQTIPEKLYMLDDEFHKYIVRLYNNEYINRIMKDIYGQNNRIRILSGQVENCTNYAQNEHLDIIGLLLCGDFYGASESLKKHLSLSKDRTLTMFISNNI